MRADGSARLAHGSRFENTGSKPTRNGGCLAGRLGIVIEGSLSDNWRSDMVTALTKLTDNRKKIAILVLLSFIALC